MPTDDYQLNISNLIHGKMQSTIRRVGIDVVVPLARLHLPAGKATQNDAPLRFTSGTLLTNPKGGAIEYDGTNLYFTNSANVRKAIALV